MTQGKKKKMPKWVIIVIVVLIILIIGSFGSTNKENSNNKKTTDEKQDSKYMTSLEWTNSGYDYSDSTEEWLKVAVEVDNYDGDTLEAGTYTVDQTNNNRDLDKQRIYNLYITDLNTENSDEVQNNTFPVTVGGGNGSNEEIKLEKGQYLYIQKISGGSTGHLLISQK